MVGKYKVQAHIKQNRSSAQKAFYSFHIHTFLTSSLELNGLSSSYFCPWWRMSVCITHKSSVIDPYKEVTSWPDGEVAVTPKSGFSGGEMSPPTVA